MGPILLLFTAFLTIVWIGLMLINISGWVFRSIESYPKSKRALRVLVMVPCKGIDTTLEKNLKSLKEQDYPRYDLIAVVDSESDRSVPIIKKLGVRYILSSKKYKECSGKVRAQVTALHKFRNYDAYVNIDSDVECKSNHVRELVAPLSDKMVGVSTAYPYFMPVGGFWSVVKMVWGFIGNGMMESKITRFPWGGSFAFRKELVGQKEFRIFEKALSDDISIEHFVKEHGLQIAYVNKKTIVVNEDDDFGRFVEWSNRQTALTILKTRRVLYYGLLFYGAQALLLVSGIALSLLASAWYAILLLPFIIGIAKTFSRSRCAYPLIIPICFMMNFLSLANLIMASRMKAIEWRGSKYALKSPF